MNRAVGLILRLGTWVVLLVSGAYVLVYLYRWEWNRAFISGLFFLTALVSLTTGMVVRSLQQLSGRIDRLEARTRGIDQTTLTIGRSNAAHASRHFKWLREPPQGFGVFVPLLIGAGALLSALAYVIERLAGAIAGTTVDTVTARLLTPDAGLDPGRTDDEPGEGPTRRTGRHPLGLLVQVAAAAVGAAVLIGTIFIIRDATQNRTEPGAEQGTTYVRLDISQRGGAEPAEEIGEALWIACQTRLPHDASIGEITQLDDDTVELIVQQGMGPLGRRRFFGCLEDATLDHVSAHVDRFEIRRRAE